MQRSAAPQQAQGGAAYVRQPVRPSRHAPPTAAAPGLAPVASTRASSQHGPNGTTTARGRSSARRGERVACSAALALSPQDFSPSRSQGSSPSIARTQRSTKEVILSFFNFLNARDIGGLLQLMSDDVVHQDLAHEQQENNKRDVARFYLELFSKLADNMKFVVEDLTDGDCSCVGVAWHIAIEGIELPMSKGLGFYKLNKQKLICFVRQSPEHFVKVANLALSATGMASPLVNALGQAATPSFWTNVLDAASTALSTGTSSDLVNSAMASLFSSSDGAPQAGLRINPIMSTMPGVQSQGQASSSSSSATGLTTRQLQQGLPEARQRGSTVGTAAAAAARLLAPERSGIAASDAAASTSVPIQTAATTAPLAMPSTLPISPEQLASALLAAASAAASRQAAGAPSPASSSGPTSAAASAVTTAVEPVTAEVFGQQLRAQQVAAAELKNNIVCAPPMHELVAANEAAEVPLEASVSVVAAEPVNLSGIWRKDPELSDAEAYERCLDLWQISGMQRATARLIEGLEIQQRGSRFDVHHLTPIPMFKVTESYDLDKACKVMRRDLRAGQATATARALDDRSGIALDVTFGQPFPGRVVEVYRSPEPGVMHVTSTVFMKDQQVAVTQVYRLQDSSMTKQDFIRDSEKRNGNHKDILRKFGAPL